jgi:hypothetical protein
METYALKTPAPPVLSIIDWVAENPQNAAKVGAGLIVFGLAIFAIAAIFSS